MVQMIQKMFRLFKGCIEIAADIGIIYVDGRGQAWLEDRGNKAKSYKDKENSII